MTDLDSIDYFTDARVLEDPFPYYEHLRGKCQVQHTGPNGMMSVTGFDEAVQIYRDVNNFSTCNTTSGPFLTFPELVNNAALIHDEVQLPVVFWKKSLAASVDLLDIGLRGSFVASYYAAPS